MRQKDDSGKEVQDRDEIKVKVAQKQHVSFTHGGGGMISEQLDFYICQNRKKTQHYVLYSNTIIVHSICEGV